MMKSNKVNDVEYLTFPSFEKFDFLYHGFSTRIGGISDGIYSTMNLTFSTGDDRDRIIENYRIFCNALGIEAESLVFGDQTHTCNVISVDAEDQGKGIFRPKPWHDVDGLITNSLGTSLVTLYADCVPLFFVDPVNKVVATSHAGWRGTVGGIAAKTITEMMRLYNSNPKDIYAAIGPSIGACCFETDESVAKEFLALPSEIIDNCIAAKVCENENTNNSETANNGNTANKSETVNNGKSKSNSENKNYFENTNIVDNIINVDNIKTTNKYMKRIAEKLNIEANLTTYIARHSFAHMAEIMGYSYEFIQESMGHSDLRTTKEYLGSFNKDTKVDFANSLENMVK